MSSITNAWVGALSNFGQNIRYGGSQVALFSVIVACFVQWIITLGLSELASAFPSSGVRLIQRVDADLHELASDLSFLGPIPLCLHHCPGKAQAICRICDRMDVNTRMVDGNMFRLVSGGQWNIGTWSIFTSRSWDQTVA